MLVAEILKDKGEQVHTATPGDTVSQAARLLDERRVGAVIICDDDRVVGVLSERDLVRAIARDGARALDRPVSDYMTGEVVFAQPNETIDDLMGRMTDRRIRHLPVLRDQRLSGIVSIGDLVKCKIAETTHEAETLKAYIVAG